MNTNAPLFSAQPRVRRSPGGDQRAADDSPAAQGPAHAHSTQSLPTT